MKTIDKVLDRDDVIYDNGKDTHAIYKNKNGEISLFSWVNDTIVQNIDNYFARKQYVCEKCHTKLKKYCG